jgi:hypothetical protein
MELKLIIGKYLIAKGFYITLEGHKPNPKFYSVLGESINDYKAAFWLGKTIKHALELAGNKVTLFNDSYAKKDGPGRTRRVG